MGEVEAAQFRVAGPADAAAAAELHVERWRSHYRGAYSDAFLDGDVSLVELRRAVCARRRSVDAECGPFDHHRCTRPAGRTTFGGGFGRYMRDRFHGLLPADHVPHQ